MEVSGCYVSLYQSNNTACFYFCQKVCLRAVCHVSVTPGEQWQGQPVTAPRGNVFVSHHDMERTAVAADLVS